MRLETKGNARTSAILIMLAVLALAVFIAMGGDGADNADHAVWMAATKDAGSAVIW